jgi:hypothetical protein
MNNIIQGYDGSRHASSSELASTNKKRGHSLEKIYASRVKGHTIDGVGKTDVVEANGERSSCKGAKKHIQILLQSKDNTIDFFGKEHPISKFVIYGYKVKKYKIENNNKVNVSDKKNWKLKADELAVWLKNKNNFKEVLEYIFSNNSIDNIVILEEADDDAYKFKLLDVVNFYINLNYETYTTPGCKVVIKSAIPMFSDKPLVIFNLELRGSVGKVGSINYWNDSQRFYKTLKLNLKHKIIRP